MLIAPHVQMLYWNAYDFIASGGEQEAPHVQMLYWNNLAFDFLYSSSELHMYKCCIEILPTLLMLCTLVLLHMYKCCIEIC